MLATLWVLKSTGDDERKLDRRVFTNICLEGTE